MFPNHLCCLTSLAPEPDPKRLCSSLMRSFRIADLQKLRQNCQLCLNKGVWSSQADGDCASFGLPGDGRRVWVSDFVFEHVGESGIPIRTLERGRGELRASASVVAVLRWT